MVHHGHKTEEREHALIKLNKNSLGGVNALWRAKDIKAQSVKTLCLSSMAVVVIFSNGLSAQAQVYNQNSASRQAGAEIRLQQMETQIRELTGRVEEQNYEIGQLKEKLLDLQNAQIKSQSAAPSIGASQIGVPERAPTSAAVPFQTPKISGMKTATPIGNANNVLPTEATAQYEAAFANLKAKNYDQAQAGFESFLKKHDKHLLAANAKYWLGETYYVRRDYKTAAKTFAEGFQTFPESAKAPDMLLKLGLALNGMGKKSDACVALSQVSVKFPKANGDMLSRAQEEMDRLSCNS